MTGTLTPAGQEEANMSKEKVESIDSWRNSRSDWGYQQGQVEVQLPIDVRSTQDNVYRTVRRDGSIRGVKVA